MSESFEKLGVFYLGDEADERGDRIAGRHYLYDSRDLTTHGLCVGMTGSGKTGLCLSLIEEAAIDGVPVLTIDPKGDLGNLLLSFPDLKPESFRPWVDQTAAVARGETADEYAAFTAKLWKGGLADWAQSPERIARFRDAVDLAIYTPGSDAGLALSVVGSLACPPAAVRDDGEAYRDRLTSTAASLLALLGIDADPLTSREHILLTNILDHAWAGGRDLSLADLIRQIQAPPFESLGVLDLESVFPQRDRGKLAATLNGLLASPTAAAKLAGEPLDIARLLYTETGKPRVSIVSIAHLSDAERMSFVTLLLGEFLTWTRSQAGTSSLRALLYMDEIFGFVPPVANPPSKQPLLTLLKQARAFGVGVMLATQNPVDLDYRGLSNIGTWFLGRLQTERDKARVLDGLEGAAGESGTKFDRARVEQTLSTLGKRMFLAQNVHEDGPVLFQTRWALSYLRGPLTRSQIAKLMADRKAAAAGEKRVTKASKSVPVEAEAGQGGSPPAIDSKIPVAAIGPIDERRVLQPALFGTARVHFRRTTYGVDLTRNVALVVPLDGEPPGHLWEPAEPVDDDAIDLSPELSDDARYGDVPTGLFTARGLKSAASKFKDHVYRSEAVTVRSCKALKLLSDPDEPEADFRVRITQAAREARDLAVEKIRARYATKVKSLERRKRTAEERVGREKAEADRATYSAALSFGSSLMSALFGRKLASRGNVSRASSSMRSAGSAAKQRSDVARAEEKLEDVVRDIEELEAELDDVIEAERDKFAADRLEIEEVRINATKTNITVGRVGLAWFTELPID